MHATYSQTHTHTRTHTRTHTHTHTQTDRQTDTHTKTYPEWETSPSSPRQLFSAQTRPETQGDSGSEPAAI